MNDDRTSAPTPSATPAPATAAGRADAAPVIMPVAWAPQLDATAHEAQFGKFTLLAELSRSPNGIVYRARQNDLGGRVVALKVLVDPDDPLDDRVERFRREVTHISRMRHPNIVSVFEVGETDGFTWFTMEFVDGVSLAEWLSTQGPLTDIDAAKLLIKVSRAIHYAHQRGIIHRDIKPGNILLDRETGEPMIVDFGLARDIATDLRITRTGVTMGTPPYMPPEQARGQHDMLDSRSDVYALGATLYETLTARPPFTGETAVQVMMQVLDRMPPRPRKLRPRISSDIEAIILKCLAKKQRDRYENAELLALDLERFTRAEWVHARKATMLARLARLLPARRYIIVVLIVLAAISLQWAIVRSTSGPQLQPSSRAAVPVTPAPSGQDPWEVLSGKLNRVYKEMELDGHGGETRVLYSRALLEPDVELSLTADFGRDLPGLGLFIVPDRSAALGGGGGSAPIDRGYLLWLGADRNSRAILCRNGREVTFLQETPRGGRGLRLQSGEYRITLTLTGNTVEAEVSGNRRVWFTRFEDDYPVPLPPTRRFGLVALGGSVRVSDFRHSTRPRASMGRAEDAGERLFRLGQYREALGEYQQLMLLFGGSADTEWREQMAERRQLARVALLVPPDAAPGPLGRDVARAVPEMVAATWSEETSPRAVARRVDLLIATGRVIEAAGLAAGLINTTTLRSDQRRAITLRALLWADDLELRARAAWPPRPAALVPQTDRGATIVMTPPDGEAPARLADDPLRTAQAALQILAAVRDQFALNDLAHDDRLVDPMLAVNVWCRWCRLQQWFARLQPDDEAMHRELARLESEVLQGGRVAPRVGGLPVAPGSGVGASGGVPLIGLVLTPDGALWTPDVPNAVLAMTQQLADCLSIVDAAGDTDLRAERFRLMQRVAMEQLGLRRPADLREVWQLARNAISLGLTLGMREAVAELAARQVELLITAVRNPTAEAAHAVAAVHAFAQLPQAVWPLLVALPGGVDLRRDASSALSSIADAPAGHAPIGPFRFDRWLALWRDLRQTARDARDRIAE
ncbi:MAG: protein kinase [Planctomycetota bacterium]